jgi:hypothetical protein
MTMTNFELAGLAAEAAHRFDSPLSADAVWRLVDAPNVGLGNVEDLLGRVDPASEMARAWTAVRDAARRSATH